MNNKELRTRNTHIVIAIVAFFTTLIFGIWLNYDAKIEIVDIRGNEEVIIQPIPTAQTEFYVGIEEELPEVVGYNEKVISDLPPLMQEEADLGDL